jgi:hypothetical protein
MSLPAWATDPDSLTLTELVLEDPFPATIGFAELDG